MQFVLRPMGEFEDEAATVSVEGPTHEIARSMIKGRARTCPGWLPASTNTAPMARRQKKFYDAITASKLI